jgi:hypothetical protein
MCTDVTQSDYRVVLVLRLFDTMESQSCHVHWCDSFISRVKGSDLDNIFLSSLFLDLLKKIAKIRRKNSPCDQRFSTVKPLCNGPMP